MEKIAIIGSFVVDLMGRAPHLPTPGETVKGSFFKMGPGGKGFNQAVAAHKAGGAIFFSTKIANDTFGNLALTKMKEESMDTKYIFYSEDQGTGAALISVDATTGQNEILVVPGACSQFTEDNIAELDNLLNQCTYLLLQLEINTEATEQLIVKAYNKGCKIILNPAPVSKIDENLYKYLYLITPNEVEAQILSNLKCESIDDCRLISNYFYDKGIKNLIITLGKKGVYIKKENTKDIILDNYKVPVVDTTGAGDAFNGGLVAGLSKGMELIEACKYANVVSNLSVTKLGTSTSMPTIEEIEEFMKLNK